MALHRDTGTRGQPDVLGPPGEVALDLPTQARVGILQPSEQRSIHHVGMVTPNDRTEGGFGSKPPRSTNYKQRPPVDLAGVPVNVPLAAHR